MPEFLRQVARLFHRYIGWNRVGFVLSVVIIGIAVTVLYRMLHKIDLDKVWAAIHATDVTHFAIAALFVAGGYFTLTFYDLFALRTIGRPDVPYRVAALAGFTSYSIGHNVGATVFTGGAVRYRIYSMYGLDAIDVAKICFVAGLTFWLGNVTVLGIGITIHPEAAGAINQLGPGINLTIGIGLLVALVCYLAWVFTAPREIGRGGWTVRLPNGPTTLLQIVIGIFDLMFCALAMYMLVPAEPHIDFITIAVIFVTATLLGFASHAPGGLGVFDAAMLVALWQYDKAELVAGLLLFRVLYYLVPFTLAITLLGVREVMLSIKGTRPKIELHPVASVTKPISTELGGNGNGSDKSPA